MSPLRFFLVCGATVSVFKAGFAFATLRISMDAQDAVAKGQVNLNAGAISSTIHEAQFYTILCAAVGLVLICYLCFNESTNSKS